MVSPTLCNPSTYPILNSHVIHRALGESQEQLREQMSRQWAGESQKFQETIRSGDAEIHRLNEVGREVEQQRDNTIHP